MFSESRNDRRRRISARVAADRVRDRDNAAWWQGSVITPQKLAMASQGSSISPRT